MNMSCPAVAAGNTTTPTAPTYGYLIMWAVPGAPIITVDGSGILSTVMCGILTTPGAGIPTTTAGGTGVITTVGVGYRDTAGPRPGCPGVGPSCYNSQQFEDSF